MVQVILINERKTSHIQLILHMAFQIDLEVKSFQLHSSVNHLIQDEESDRFQEKSKNIECLTCLDKFEESRMISITNCEHQFCSNCTESYIQQSIKTFCLIKCMGGCSASFRQNEQMAQIFGQKCLKKYKKIQFVKQCQKRGVKHCQSEDCDFGILGSNQKLRNKNLLKCNKCSKKYCSKCLWPRHKGQCQYFAQSMIQDNLLFGKCPTCKQIIEKSEGCIHMSCVCKYQFCYDCLEQWKNGHICKEQNMRKIKMEVVRELGNIDLSEQKNRNMVQERAQEILNQIVQKQKIKQMEEQYKQLMVQIQRKRAIKEQIQQRNALLNRYPFILTEKRINQTVVKLTHMKKRVENFQEQAKLKDRLKLQSIFGGFNL